MIKISGIISLWWICHWGQKQPFRDVFQSRWFLKTSQFWSLFLIKVAGLLLQNTHRLLLDFRGSRFFSAEYGISSWRSHRFLFQNPLKTRVKPRKQSLELFYKKRCSYNFCKCCRKTLVLKSPFNRLTSFIKKEILVQMFSCGIYELLRNIWFEVYERLLLKPVLSPRLLLLITYTSSSNCGICSSDCIIIYSFAS